MTYRTMGVRSYGLQDFHWEGEEMKSAAVGLPCNSTVIAQTMIAVEADGKSMERPRTDGLGICIHQLYGDYSATNHEREC